jgi:hypothetical protein
MANELAYNVFFNLQSNLNYLQEDIDKSNAIKLKGIWTDFHFQEQVIHIDRSNEVGKLSELIVNDRNVLISGESGSGKSAVIKEYFEKYKNNENFSFFYINAGELETKSVNDIFNIEHSYTLAEFRDYFKAFNHKILIIDSSEKLLEISNRTPMLLLLEELRNEGWLFIFTCKSYIVKDLLQTIQNDLKISVSVLNVSNLTKEVLLKLSDNYQISLPKSQKLSEQLQVPFYLARYCEVESSEISDIIAFKELVWNQKVRGDGNKADRLKHENCLLDIAKKSLDSYIVPSTDIDVESAVYLEKEEILKEYPHRGFYIRHDIYVDWSLDYIIDNDFTDKQCIKAKLQEVNPNILYVNAFKRWLENEIKKVSERAQYICRIVLELNLDKRWQQAIFEMIGSSDKFAVEWFEKNDSSLKANNYIRFNEFVDVLTVSCKTISQYFTFEGKEYPLMKPVGSGWDASVVFIDKYVDNYYQANLPYVFKLTSDYCNKSNSNKEIRYKAGILALRIFVIIAKSRIKGKSFWMQQTKSWCQNVINYATELQNELKNIFKEVVENKWVSYSDPYAELAKFVVTEPSTSINCIALYSCCPNEVIELLKLLWAEHDEKDLKEPIPVNPAYRDSTYYFGINEQIDELAVCFPPSALKTPIYLMLKAESLLKNKTNYTLKFLIDFMNCCVDTYVERGRFADDEIEIIKLYFYDEEHKIISSQNLWNLYRGTSSWSMPYLLQNIHMALEKYLLELAMKSENKVMVSDMLWYILEHTHSVSLYAVVSSVAMAYPDDYFDILLLLMQDLKFLSMDLMRYSSERCVRSISFAYSGHKLLWQERKNSSELKHRKNHLEQMLTNLQITYGLGTKKDDKDKLLKLYEVVDNLKEQISFVPEEQKWLYNYTIARIDCRSMKIEKIDLEGGKFGLQFTPKLSTSMQEEQKKMEVDNNEMLRGITLRNWIEKRYIGDIETLKEYSYEKNPRLVLKDIRNIRHQLEIKDKGLYLLPSDEFLPFMGSSILLMQYSNILNKGEIKECVETLIDSLSSNFLLSSTLSKFEICIEGIPSILRLMPEYNAQIRSIILHFAGEHHKLGNFRPCDIIEKMILKNDLWKKEPEFLNSVVEEYKQQIFSKSFENMTADEAASLISILTTSPAPSMKQYGDLCIIKIADFWQTNKDKYSSSPKCTLSDAYLVAEYILKAPAIEVNKLIEPYKKYLSTDKSYEPLLSAFLITCTQYGLYENFWAVWYAIYDVMITDLHTYYNSPVLNEYMLNPSFLRQNSDNWFKIEEKDISFFEKIASDIPIHPTTLYAIVKVFSTIGKKYFKNIVPIIDSIIKRKELDIKDSKKYIIYYLDDMIRHLLVNYSYKLKENKVFYDEVIDILEFMTKNGSSIAANLLKKI